HLMENPVYTVQVMIVCSIAIQSISVAALWRSIDWRSLPMFLTGGVLGVPAGVYLLLRLPSGTYRHVIGGLLIVYAGYLLLRRPSRILRTGPLSDAFAGFLCGLTGGPGRLSRRFLALLGRREGMGQGAPARRLSTVHPRHAADHAARYLSHAAVILDADATRLENDHFHSSCVARCVVRMVHLQATLGSAI